VDTSYTVKVVRRAGLVSAQVTLVLNGRAIAAVQKKMKAPPAAPPQVEYACAAAFWSHSAVSAGELPNWSSLGPILAVVMGLNFKIKSCNF
jgi:hypothetical protein